MTEINYYELLDLSPSASGPEIRAAYHRVARLAHPDVGGTAGMFRLLSSAYETLRDPAARTAYDALLAGDASGGARPASAAEPTPQRRPQPRYEKRPYEQHPYEQPREEQARQEQAQWEQAPREGPRHEEPWPDESRREQPRAEQPRPEPEPESTASGRAVYQTPWHVYRTERARHRAADMPAARSRRPARRFGPAVKVGCGLAIVASYVAFSYLLFGNWELMVPDAAGDDLAQWVFRHTPVLQVSVMVYTVALIGIPFGSLPVLLGAHAAGAVGLIAWPFAYWDVAVGTERWLYAGGALLWIGYSVLLVMVVSALAARRMPLPTGR